MTVYSPDVAAGVAYARRWAFSRNPAYYNFDRLGGDCTNFVSQCIFAAGAVMNYTPDVGWFYRSLNDRAAAWTGVEYLFRFLLHNRGRGPFARETGPEEIRPGDVVQLGDETGFYHSLYVVGLRDGVPLVAAHTFDAFGRPLNSYGATRLRALRIEGARK